MLISAPVFRLPVAVLALMALLRCTGRSGPPDDADSNDTNAYGYGDARTNPSGLCCKPIVITAGS